MENKEKQYKMTRRRESRKREAKECKGDDKRMERGIEKDRAKKEGMREQSELRIEKKNRQKQQRGRERGK